MIKLWVKYSSLSLLDQKYYHQNLSKRTSFSQTLLLYLVLTISIVYFGGIFNTINITILVIFKISPFSLYPQILSTLYF